MSWLAPASLILPGLAAYYAGVWGLICLFRRHWEGHDAR